MEPDPKPDVEAEENPWPDADDGCGLLRPDPDGDDPKRSGPEGDPDSPKPEADPDSEAEGDLGPNLNGEGDPDVELEPEVEAEPEAEADEELLADAPLSDLGSPLLTFKWTEEWKTCKNIYLSSLKFLHIACSVNDVLGL